MRKFAFALIAAWMLPAALHACSLCGNVMSRNNSLVYEFEQAQVVAYGHLANAKFSGGGVAGTTEFHIERIIKDDPAFPRQKMLIVSKFLPIINPKAPPKYVMFFQKQKLEPYWGKEVANPAVLDFVADLLRYRNDPEKMLLHAAKHFDHKDPYVADEAFMVFAKADDKLLAKTAHNLDPANLRKLVADPDMEPERLSMFAFLLGACGKDGDADLLRKRLKNPTAKAYRSFEGILAGYIMLRPKEGWQFVQDSLKDDKQSFLLRYATLRTMRFFYNAKPEKTGPQVMQGLAQAITHADLADMAIQDLQRWKRWEHTKLILSCWDKESHNSPIVKQSIVRYALACQQPEARALLERARRADPDLVRAMEEELK